MKAFGAAAALSIAVVFVAQPMEGTAVLKGRVVDAISGKPLRGVAIRAIYQPRPPATYDSRPPDRTARTDSNGAFEMMALTAGDYAVYGSNANPGTGYLEISLGIKRPGGQRSHLSIAEGARLDITLRAWPAASISGRVIDERGRPLVGIGVSLMAKDSDQYGSASTNDLGEYRIGGLPPGRYSAFVPVRAENRTLKANPEPRPATASSPSLLFPYLVDRDRRTILYGHDVLLAPPSDDGHANVFVSSYHGGTSAVDAIYWTLAAGEERGDVDITLRARPGRRVAGVVTVASGSVAGVIVTLAPPAPANPRDSGRFAATAAGDGTFVFIAAPEGSYTLTARRRGPPLTEVTLAGGVPSIAQDDVIVPDADGLGADMPLTIGDRDVDDLVVHLGPGTRIAGRAIFENEPFDPKMMTVRPFLSHVADTSFGEDTRPLRVAADGTLSGNAQPGVYALRLQAVPRGWSLTGALINGRDVGDGPIAVGSDPIGDLELRFSRAGTVVRGEIASPERPSMADTTVVAFSTNRNTWSELRSGESVRAKSVTARGGKYKIAGLLPGEYFVVAVDENFSATALSLSMLARLAEGAARVRLEPGQPATLNLTPQSINP